MLYSFVILHYIAEKDTIECVDSIRKTYKRDNYSIVIVDNGSPNGSGARIEKLYQDSTDIKVILSEKNLGFAKGNNLGYDYCKNVLKSKFIIFCNNDILFEQKEFLNKISEIYQEEQFDVLGPDILDRLTNSHSSPMSLIPLTKEKLKKDTRKLEIIQFLTSNDYIETIFNFGMKIKHVVFGISPSVKTAEIDVGKRHYNCVLQGSCIIFSEKYIETHIYAFFPDTFLYFEEYILQYLIEKEQGKLMYAPELSVIHKGHVSTNMEYNNKKKARFTAKQQNLSRRVLLNLMDEREY